MNAFGIPSNAAATNEAISLVGLSTIREVINCAAEANRTSEGILFVDEYTFRMQDHHESVGKILS